MADSYLDGLRRMFGLQPGQSIRGNQLQRQEDQILNPQLRQAPVQPAAAPAPVDFATQQRMEEEERRQQDLRLQQELERLRNGG